MSALPPKAEIETKSRDVRFVMPGSEATPRITGAYSVTRHAHKRNACNLPFCVKAKQKTGRVAARKRELHVIECLIPDDASS
jgi:hypothetical protein